MPPRPTLTTAIMKMLKLPTWLQPVEGTTYYEKLTGKSGIETTPKAVGFLHRVLYGVPDRVLERKQLKDGAQKGEEKGGKA